MLSLHSLETHGAAGKVLMDSAMDMNYGNGPLASNERDRGDAKVGDDYTLMRDCDASSRLTAQHYLWKNLLGYLLHPDIPTPRDGWKIADIATGNGIWLQDLAECSLPSTELHGFDISLDQVGPTPWLQDNMHMHIWDVFEEPPPQFLGFFDVVHVRLLTVVVKNNDPRPLLKNITKLLKPGGYLQWGEVDTVGYSIKTVPGVAVENLRAIFSQLGGPDNWKPSFTEILNQNGYSGSALYTYKYGLGTARIWNDMYVGAWKELAERTLKTPEVCDELELKVMEEVRNGAAIMAPKLVWIAQKV